MSTNTLQALELDNPFWAFSLAYWENPSVQKALLALQDEYDLDINLLLFAIWVSVEKNLCLSLVIQQAETLSTYWQKKVITPVRQARQALRKEHPLRSTLLKTELESEQHEQAALFQLSEAFSHTPQQRENMDLLIENLICCLESCGCKHQYIPKSLALTLVQAAFPTLSLEQIEQHLTIWSL